MAKKQAKPIDADARATLHADQTAKLTAMINRAGWLRDQGRTEAARRMLVRIDRLSEEIKQLQM